MILVFTAKKRQSILGMQECRKGRKNETGT
jgi:hypothetical protein